MARVLIIDDEPPIRKIVSILLKENGHQVCEAESAEEGIEQQKGFQPSVALLDLSLPKMSGLEAIPHLLEASPPPSIIIMTAYGSIRSAVEAMRAGAFDYLPKPFDNDELLMVIDRALELQRLSAEVESLRQELEMRYGFSEIIGISPPMQQVFRIMSKVKDVDATVLVVGESGTGKELVARAIHRHSKRTSNPFVAVNCSAIPETLLEAEFFGAEAGAFTDARELRIGKFEEAHRGTLFLDEIGDLPLDAQAKFLRVLQDRRITRLGGKGSIEVDVRIIAATNRSLEEMVAERTFREDLFWRINVVQIKLPPLRERGDDLSLLVDYMLDRNNREMNLEIQSLHSDARALLLAYEWPGNVRELENALCQAMILCDGNQLRPKDLPPRVRGEMVGRVSGARREFDFLTLAEAVAASSAKVERQMIVSRLASCSGNRTATADSLGISRKTLFNKMKQYEIGASEGDG
ncbi:MAG: sigma-54 dependent transcriptional regulator [Acidobacteriota bacterium]